MVIVTGSPSRSLTPTMETSTNFWFGGQSCEGLATAPVQSGGWLPGSARLVVVVDDELVVVDCRVLVVVLDVVVDGRVVVEAVVVVGGRVVVVLVVVGGV